MPEHSRLQHSQGVSRERVRVFLLTTLILYILGRLGWSSIYVSFIALGIPIGCATFVDNMLEKSKEKQTNTEDSWSTNPDELVKTKKNKIQQI